MIISVLDSYDSDLLSAGAARGVMGSDGDWRLCAWSADAAVCMEVRDRVLGCVHVIVQSENK